MVQAVWLVIQARSFSFTNYYPGSGPGLGVSSNSPPHAIIWVFVKLLLHVIISLKDYEDASLSNDILYLYFKLNIAVYCKAEH